MNMVDPVSGVSAFLKKYSLFESSVKKGIAGGVVLVFVENQKLTFYIVFIV